MGKKIIIQCIIYSLICSCNAKELKIPSVTDKYIKATERLCCLSDDNVGEAGDLQLQIQHMFFASTSGSGIQIHNPDIYIIGAYSEKNKITSQSYSIQLKRLFFDKRKLTVKNKYLLTEIILKPDFNEDVPHLYKSSFKKEFCYNNDKYVIWQQICVPYDDSSVISEIISQDKEFDKKKVENDTNIDQKSEHELLNLAAEFYTKKNYVSAYNTYQTVTQKYPKNGEAWLRLAIMTFYNKGCKFKDKKERALKYLDNALPYLHGKQKDRVEDMKHYWKYPNFM